MTTTSELVPCHKSEHIQEPSTEQHRSQSCQVSHCRVGGKKEPKSSGYFRSPISLPGRLVCGARASGGATWYSYKCLSRNSYFFGRLIVAVFYQRHDGTCVAYGRARIILRAFHSRIARKIESVRIRTSVSFSFIFGKYCLIMG